MDKQQVTELLKALPPRLDDPPRPALAVEIKRRIPERLIPHRMDTINIIVDLRISRVVAAAAVLVALALIGVIAANRSGALETYHDGKLMLQYALGGEDAYKGDVLSGLVSFRDSLIAQGREVVYYGDRADPKDKMAILMHWKLSDDQYGVILGDLSARTVSSTTLIRLQARMLRDCSK